MRKGLKARERLHSEELYSGSAARMEYGVLEREVLEMR